MSAKCCWIILNSKWWTQKLNQFWFPSWSIGWVIYNLTAKISLCLIYSWWLLDMIARHRCPFASQSSSSATTIWWNWRLTSLIKDAASCNIFHLRLAGSVNHLKIWPPHLYLLLTKNVFDVFSSDFVVRFPTRFYLKKI